MEIFFFKATYTTKTNKQFTYLLPVGFLQKEEVYQKVSVLYPLPSARIQLSKVNCFYIVPSCEKEDFLENSYPVLFCLIKKISFECFVCSWIFSEAAQALLTKILHPKLCATLVLWCLTNSTDLEGWPVAATTDLHGRHLVLFVLRRLGYCGLFLLQFGQNGGLTLWERWHFFQHRRLKHQFYQNENSRLAWNTSLTQIGTANKFYPNWNSRLAWNTSVTQIGTADSGKDMNTSAHDAKFGSCKHIFQYHAYLAFTMSPKRNF